MGLTTGLKESIMNGMYQQAPVQAIDDRSSVNKFIGDNGEKLLGYGVDKVKGFF
jgi:hypothetical protein